MEHDRSCQSGRLDVALVLVCASAMLSQLDGFDWCSYHRFLCTQQAAEPSCLCRCNTQQAGTWKQSLMNEECAHPEITEACTKLHTLLVFGSVLLSRVWLMHCTPVESNGCPCASVYERV